jgi:antitoxin component of RelBE/YafQ-DinJ toxin-antitoxin module
MNKETELNIRLEAGLKEDLETIAEYNGLTISSYIQSVLLKKVSEVKENEPRIFQPHLYPKAVYKEISLEDLEKEIERSQEAFEAKKKESEREETENE